MYEVPPLIQSAFDKVERAKSHIDQLDAEFQTWFPRSYRVWTEANFQRGEISQYVLQAEPLPDSWSIIVGDAIHDLRSALDHLVWGLTVYHQGREPAEPLPPAKQCPWRNVAFPIRLLQPRTWPPQGIRGIDPRLYQDPLRAGAP